MNNLINLKTKLYKYLGYSITIISILILVSIFTISLSHVFSSQLSFADDASIAVASKNLAMGNGYSTSVPFNNQYGIDRFSSGITTGPTLVLPSSLLIVLFGNQLWAPGISVLFTILLLTVIISIILSHHLKLKLSIIYSAIFLLFLYNITAGIHFEHWFSLLGELPAGLYTILGIVIISISPKNLKYIATGCLFLGLAFMTKMISLLGFLSVELLFLFLFIKSKNERKKLFIYFVIGNFFFFLPYGLFEIYKLLSLGFNDYLNHIHKFINSFHAMSKMKNNDASIEIVTLVLNRINSFKSHFSIALYQLFLIGLVSSFLIYKYANNTKVKYLFTLLIIAFGIHLFYWVLFSPGWYRYSLIGLFLYFSSISLVVFTRVNKLIIMAFFILSFALFKAPSFRLLSPIENFKKHGFTYNQTNRNLQKTVEYLNNSDISKPYISSWWATLVDIEYALPNNQNFKHFSHMDRFDYCKEFLVVSNEKWVSFLKNEEFDNFTKDIVDTLFYAPPYLIKNGHITNQTLKNGEDISFKNNKNSSNFITYGWGHQENDFRWTIAEHSGLAFILNNNPIKNSSFNIQASGFLYKKRIIHQKVILSVNNTVVDSINISNYNWYNIKIPKGILKKGVNHLNLEIPYSISPSTLGTSGDSRTLGIAVRQIKINY